MLNFLTSLFSRVWRASYKHLPTCEYFNSIEHYVFMKELRRKDMSQWRAMRAREKGAKVGDNCRFFSLNFFSEPYLIDIGNNVIISGEVLFLTHDGSIHLFKSDTENILGHFGKIKIGDNCFIGMGAIILPNVEIGNNCIIGAGSVVMDSFPDDSVIFGNPAKLAFKTSLYKKLKLSSKLTVMHDNSFDTNDYESKRDYVLSKLAMIPIRRPREHKVHHG